MRRHEKVTCGAKAVRGVLRRWRTECTRMVAGCPHDGQLRVCVVDSMSRAFLASDPRPM